jgi:glycosyltransferase involved in cell wall biosynthesis
MGKPLVASSVGGHKELIRDDETGLLFRAGDPSDLVDKLCRALGDTELRRRLGCHARRFVEKERTWERAVSPYRSVYEHLIGDSRV